MLGFVPRLYQDELVYSWLARYHLYSGNVGPKQTTEELFGSRDVLAVPDLPVRLVRLIKHMKQFISMDAEQLLYKHTFYNYYTSFAELSVRDTVKKHMLLGIEKTALHMLTGVMASRVEEKHWFCYCSHCVKEDLELYGETYWRLPHQLPGVLVCTKHGCILSISCVPFRPRNRYEYVPATEKNCPITINHLKSFGKSSIDRMIEIAKELSFLSTDGFAYNPKELQFRYLDCLKLGGLASLHGRVDQKALSDSFRGYYGDDFLSNFQSDVDYYNESCWLKLITRKHRKVFHPLRHVLFILFLGENIKSIAFAQPHRPFVDIPYPCLNKAASHYRQSVINDVEVSICSDTRCPVGTFKCACGFVYSRRGPDKSENDRFKIGRIKEFGPIWFERLNELVKRKSMSFRSIACELGVDVNTVIKYSKIDNCSVTDNNGTAVGANPEQYSKWLNLMAENPNKSVTELRNLNPAAYAWLYRNDRTWLKQHSPRLNSKARGYQRIDWTKRDHYLCEEVRAAVKELLNQTPLVRLTIGKIGNSIGQRSLLEKHLDKLPLTLDCLIEVTETVESFQIRRVHHAFQTLRMKNEEVQEWQIKRLAGLRSKVSPRVESVICSLVNKNEWYLKDEF